MSFIRKLSIYNKLVVKLGCCDHIRTLYDLTYSKDDEWNLYIGDMLKHTARRNQGSFSSLIFKIKTVSFITCHRVIGCDMLTKLMHEYPSALMVPITTLLCNCPNYIIQKDFECLYRREDKAVGLDFNSFKIYLVPANSEIKHLDGFDVWIKS